ncbi:MAG: hypothetical protein ABH857_03135 [Elusimicrobiota bacterium]
MQKEVKIYKEGMEEYSIQDALISNFFMLLWIALGGMLCFFISTWIARLYTIFALVMVYVVLRKLVCANCYYYDKICHMGWGKLSAKMFKNKGSLERFAADPGMKCAAPTYMSLMFIPLILGIAAMIKEFTFIKLLVYLVFLVISYYTMFSARKKTCGKCKMRLFCPGSAVK